MRFFNKRFVVISFVLIASVYITLAQSPIPVFDFALFNLKIIKITKVAEISNEERTIQPEAGQQLVVITMEGTSPYIANPVYAPWEFAVAYETSGRSILQSVIAIALHEHAWTIADEKLKFGIAFADPGTFSMRLAALIPNDLKTFSVIVPTLATGVVPIE
jgi:hypothetical protein